MRKLLGDTRDFLHLISTAAAAVCTPSGWGEPDLGEAVMQRPIFMLVSGDGPRLDALRHDLSRRYEADYQVCVASSAAALTMLAVLAGARAEVALVIADEHLADMPAVDFLARPRACTRGCGSCSFTMATPPEHPAVLAIAVGKIDYHLYAPWYPLERACTRR